jgi:hypothetical protein
VAPQSPAPIIRGCRSQHCAEITDALVSELTHFRPTTDALKREIGFLLGRVRWFKTQNAMLTAAYVQLRHMVDQLQGQLKELRAIRAVLQLDDKQKTLAAVKQLKADLEYYERREERHLHSVQEAA